MRTRKSDNKAKAPKSPRTARVDILRAQAAPENSRQKAAAGEAISARLVEPSTLTIWPVPPTAARLVELKPCRCRWPVGSAGGVDQLFCGDITETDAGPYCPDHAQAARGSVRAADWDRKHAKSLKRAVVA